MRERLRRGCRYGCTRCIRVWRLFRKEKRALVATASRKAAAVRSVILNWVHSDKRDKFNRRFRIWRCG